MANKIEVTLDRKDEQALQGLVTDTLSEGDVIRRLVRWAHNHADEWRRIAAAYPEGVE